MVNAGGYRDQLICRSASHVMIYVLATIDVYHSVYVYYSVYVYHTVKIYQGEAKDI